MAPGIYFGGNESEIIYILFNEIPRIGLQTAFDLLQKTRGPIEGDMAVPSKTDADQVIEADEMVHVGMAYTDMLDLQDIPGR